MKNLQQTHSKARPLQYATFKLQEYLGSESKISLKEKAFMFAVRTRMIDLKSNFKAGKRDLKCRLFDKHEEDQKGLLLCSALNSDPSRTPLYTDLFSERKEKTTYIALILKEKFQSFQNLQVQGQRHSQPSAASSLNANHVNFDDEDMG